MDKKLIFWTDAMSLIYLMLSVFKHIIKLQYGFIYLENANMPVISIVGCISPILILISTMIIIFSKGKFIRKALLVQAVESVLVSYIIIYKKASQSIPELALVILGILIALIIYRYTLTYEKNRNTLSYIAKHDTLTKCLNRRGLIEELHSRADNDKEFFLVFLDLDNFKQVNDTLGHEAGDKLLIETALKWSNLETSENYTLARLGGDEFAMIVESSDINEMKIFIQEVLDTVSNSSSPYSSYVTASAGIAHYTKDSSDINKLLSYADTAMYKAKTSGKNSYYFFDSLIYDDIKEGFYIEEYIKSALRGKGFELKYQPQFDIKSHKLIGFETLLRLKKSNGEYVNTQKFINIAEKSGLIVSIDKWVADHALKEAKYIINKYPDIDISINISGKHISSKDCISDILKSVEKTGFPANNLKIEITESSYIKSINDAIGYITELKKYGIKIALDDFGTGFSSLSYLASIPVNLVKIDKSFVDTIFDSESRERFVGLIINLGHLMNCTVIAEGVETEKQLKKLENLSCDSVQGFIWGKPISIEEVLSSNF